MNSILHVGLDVHKENFKICVFKNSEQQPYILKTIPNNDNSIKKFFTGLKNQGTVIACYEAGCLGLTLYRLISKIGIECIVAAPGKIPRKPNDRIKTDTRDAASLAKLLRNNELTPIHILSGENEMVRDYLRARGDAMDDLKRNKQRMLKFLLRYSYLYGSNRYWTGKHRKWMKSIAFPSIIMKETFESYYTTVTESEEKISNLDLKIKEIAESDKYRVAVGKLRCFKGIDYLTALSLICEIEDFRRFKNAGSFMSFLGLVPSEYSTGHKRRQGSITKSGNSHLRKLLIESSWHYRYHSNTSKRLMDRRKGQPIEIISYANCAMARLQRKFTKLVFKGKSKNTAVTAVARELSGFIWGLMTDNIA